ncbi:MAG: nucleoside deaminase [Thermoanaerobaculales bacterium]|nr:nucleoside deaminase [Thermoanaerobaculales bacterium]
MLPPWVFNDDDRLFMGGALVEAEAAAERNEVPVGAVLVRDGEVLARAGNQRELSGDPTAHAEILVLREGGRSTGDWRLSDATLYVTLEPCPMCLEACRQARIGLIIWGAADPVMGACGSVVDFAEDPRLTPRLAQRGGLESEKCARLLQRFFAKRRDPY